jgi:hypothetical protein
MNGKKFVAERYVQNSSRKSTMTERLFPNILKHFFDICPLTIEY